MNERIRIMGCHLLRPAPSAYRRAKMLQLGLRVIDMRSVGWMRELFAHVLVR